MTPEEYRLLRRLVRESDWKWQAGMLSEWEAIHGQCRVVDTDDEGISRWTTRIGDYSRGDGWNQEEIDKVWSTKLPDLTDHATGGCMLTKLCNATPTTVRVRLEKHGVRIVIGPDIFIGPTLGYVRFVALVTIKGLEQL